MATQGTQATSAPPAGFWKLRHAVIGLGVLMLVVLMVRACGDDDEESQKQSRKQEADMPRQGIVVQIPASQLPGQQAPMQAPVPQQPAYGYAPGQTGSAYSYTPGQAGGTYGYAPQAPAQAQPQAPMSDAGNPWAVQRQPSYGYGQPEYQQWGRQQPQQPPQTYAQPPSVTPRYRPLDTEQPESAPSRPVQQPVQGYYPVAPYDRPGGSSFAAPAYPYAGAYPGYYGAGGVYGVPGAGYGYPPVYPGGVPAVGWPRVW